MRPGSAMLSATSDGTDAPQATSREEAVVSEHAAAFLARHRAAEVIEIVERTKDDVEKT
jgi:hypothetical protein